jgi:DNA-binding beta-propeller fold protein YncE
MVDWPTTFVVFFGVAFLVGVSALLFAVQCGTRAGGARFGRTPARWPKRKEWILAIAAGVIIATIAGTAVALVSRGVCQARESNRERELALPFSGLREPGGVAVDAAGDVYVADSGTNRVLKLVAGSGAQIVLPFTNLDLDTYVTEYYAGVAVDAGGDVYVADSAHNRVVKLAPGSSTETVLPFSNLDDPSGVAVDAAGTVYVADSAHNRVLKLSAGSSAQTVLPSIDGAVPDGVAVDTAGAVYVSASKRVGTNKPLKHFVLRLAAGSDTWTALASVGVRERYVTVDAAANVYGINTGDTGGVIRAAPGSGDWIELAGGVPLQRPGGLAVDTLGNVYVTDNLTPAKCPGQQGLVAELPAG